MDLHNEFSQDYWNPKNYQKRKAEERAAAEELAVKQDQSNRAPWEALGSFLGDTGKNIGNFFNSMAPSESTSEGILNGIGSGGTSPFMPSTQRSNSSSGADLLLPNRMSGQDTDFLSILGGKYNSDNARTPENNSVLANPMFEPEPEGPNATDILKRLGERFSFDPGSIDTSALDSVFQNNMNQLNGVRDTTNENFQESDANIAGMYGAHQKDVQGQTGAIQQRGEANTKAIGGIFDQTINSNNAKLAQERKTEEEMLRRLGIAPAANQPDLFGQAVQEGNNQAAASRDTRMAESRTNTQTDVSRNNTLASAVGNDGLQRRSDLNMRLQEILGDLGAKETDFQNDYQQNKLELTQRAEDKSYDRWLQDRQFDMGLFQSINSANAESQAKQDQYQNNIDVAQIRAGASANGGSGSSDGWIGSSSPEFQNAFFDVAQKVDISRNPQEAIRLLADPKYGLNPREVVTKITDYANLGSVKADSLQ